MVTEMDSAIGSTSAKSKQSRAVNGNRRDMVPTVIESVSHSGRTCCMLVSEMARDQYWESSEESWLGSFRKLGRKGAQSSR